MPQTLRRIVVCALTACAIAIAGSLPAAASVEHGRVKLVAAAPVQKKKPTLCDKARFVRRAVVKKYTKEYTQRFGKKLGKKRAKRKPGRDVCRYGLKHGKNPTTDQTARYLRTLRRLKNPPRPSVQPATTIPAATTPQPVASPQSSGAVSGAATGTLPSCASESGTNYSTGPGNTNPSGATGRYQEMPEHRQSGGICEGLDLSPGGQDECAVRIYRSQGSGAWVGCG
jgi:hypothetical protein